MTSNLHIAGLILCGGKSTRMGTDKSALPVGDETLLTRTVRIVGAVTDNIAVAAAPGQTLPELPPHVIVTRDKVTGAGPLAGIAAGFEQLADGHDAILVVPCDHPFLSAEFLQELIRTFRPDDRALIPALDDRPTPTLGVYRSDTLDLIRQALEERRLRLEDVARQCNARVVDARSIVDPEVARRSLVNVNDRPAYRDAMGGGVDS